MPFNFELDSGEIATYDVVIEYPDELEAPCLSLALRDSDLVVTKAYMISL